MSSRHSGVGGFAASLGEGENKALRGVSASLSDGEHMALRGWGNK